MRMPLELPILVFFLIGLLCLLIPQRNKLALKVVAAAGALLSLAYAILNALNPLTHSISGLFLYRGFSGLMALGFAFFGFIVVIYSLKYAEALPGLNKYYGFMFWCVSFSLFTVYSASLITFTIFWGLSGLTLYLLANNQAHASNAAKKAFVFLGGSDALMILGIVIYGISAGSFDMYGATTRIAVAGASPAIMVSFLCLAVAALTKAGAMPFHTWIPDFAQEVPMSITAFLPAALDKLLGIFLLTVICQQLFVIGMPMTILLLAVGAFTVISAVFMAMAQHDMRKLLAYHAVSQVGYMVIGIASGTAIGIAGAVFHMLNHAIYKSTLFLSGGAVEHRTGTTDLGRLGGLSKYMPVTFIICVIASLSISGIPPLNGFVSKWMIYQGLFQQVTNPDFSNAARACFAVALAVAMFGSALTLASFIKLLHSVFLGQPSGAKTPIEEKPREVGFTMLLPMGILAALCVIFGVLAYPVPLKTLILPAIFTFGIYIEPISGLWQSGPAFTLMIVGIILGVIVYLFSKTKIRKDMPFTGGEPSQQEGRFEGLEFYKSITQIGIFAYVYRLAEKKVFDIYNLLTKLVLAVGTVLSELHTGSLRTYMLWFIIGIIAIFAFLVGKF